MNEKLEPKNPFPPGGVAGSIWNSEQSRIRLHERTIALLSGELEPQNQQDKDYLRDMGGVRGKKAGWPKRWATCNRCGSEWQATGFPAPTLSAKYQFTFRRNRFGDWLFPGVCEACDDELHAIKPPPTKLVKTSKNRSPYKDSDL